MDKAERASLRALVFDRENDEAADSQFPWRQMIPEEWVARHSHTVGCFSLHRFRYRNAELGQWMRRVGDLLFSGEEALDGYRKRYLSPAEYDRIQEEIANQRWE
jgi:hypothetical protein